MDRARGAPSSESVANLHGGGDHSYHCMATSKPECTSARTRGGVSILERRDPASVDDIFMQRVCHDINDVLRPVECLIGFPDYRRILRVAMESATELHGVCALSGQLVKFLEDHDGAMLPLAWPPNRYLRLTSGRKLGYLDEAERLRKDYPVCNGPLEVLGLILAPGQSLYSDLHPVLMMSLTGVIFLHVRGRPVWNPDYDPDRDAERVFLVAESLQAFGREGLCRCDNVYTEDGGAPYATPEDPVLKNIVFTPHPGGMALYQQICKIKGHSWYINGCPGMLKDRVFVATPDLPPFVRHVNLERFGNRFLPIGRVTRSPEEPECEMFIMVDAGGAIYGHMLDSGKVRKLAQNFDQFMRIGTRRAYFNFEMVRGDSLNTEYEETSFGTKNQGFSLLTRDLVTVRKKIQ
ncbi:M128 protein [Murid betaherpesvirus 1]|nr:M128 protein [Murid betaherpesvirus 1]